MVCEANAQVVHSSLQDFVTCMDIAQKDGVYQHKE